MRTIDIRDFESKCVELIDEVHATAEPITIAKNGVAVWQVQPVAVAELTEGA